MRWRARVLIGSQIPDYKLSYLLFTHGPGKKHASIMKDQATSGVEVRKKFYLGYILKTERPRAEDFRTRVYFL